MSLEYSTLGMLFLLCQHTSRTLTLTFFRSTQQRHLMYPWNVWQTQNSACKHQNAESDTLPGSKFLEPSSRCGQNCTCCILKAGSMWTSRSSRHRRIRISIHQLNQETQPRHRFPQQINHSADTRYGKPQIRSHQLGRRSWRAHLSCNRRTWPQKVFGPWLCRVETQVVYQEGWVVLALAQFRFLVLTPWPASWIPVYSPQVCGDQKELKHPAHQKDQKIHQFDILIHFANPDHHAYF